MSLKFTCYFANTAIMFESLSFLYVKYRRWSQIQRQYTAKTKWRKFETNIPRKGISGSQSQFPHSCVCDRIIYSHGGSAFLLEEICGPILRIYKSLTDTWIWKQGLRPRYSQERNIWSELPLQCKKAWSSLLMFLFHVWSGPKHFDDFAFDSKLISSLSRLINSPVS